MSLALLFPGQGAQHPAMLGWLDACPEAAATLQHLAAQVGADWRARLADADWAQRNAVAQPLLTGLGIAAWQCLAAKLPAPAVVAGYSVGELAAFCVAGVFEAELALALACDRAAAMDRSVAGQDTGLLAVQWPDSARLAAACQRHGLALAIRIAADRVVLGGRADALAAAEPALLAVGARCTRLAVRIASHTPFVQAAAAEFEARLAALVFTPPRPALVCNFSGAAERQPARLKRALAQQIGATVQWDSCLDAIAERRVRCVLEVGPGHALAALWNDRHPDIPARSVDEFRSAEAVAHWVDAALR